MTKPYIEQREVGSILRRRAEKGQRGDPLLSVTQTHGVIPQAEAGRRNISSENKSTYWRVYPGDIAYNTMRMWQGASARSLHFGIVSPAYTVCTPVEGVSSDYLAYALKLPENVIKFGARSQGITSDVWNLRFDELSRISIPVVSDDKNRERIAEILSTVDEAIEQTEALIAKTQQIKAGLMHDLFTRGVAPDGKLRPPREEAPQLYMESPLGWIPKEWDVAPVGEMLAGIDAGSSPECPDSPASADQWGVIKVGAMHPSGFKEAENKVVLNRELWNSAFLVKRGDLLISRANTMELVGLVCHVQCDPKNLMLSDKSLRLRVNSERAHLRFLFWSLQHHDTRRQIENAASGTSGSMKNISQIAIKGLIVRDPKGEEPSRIASRLDSAQELAVHHEVEAAKLRSLKYGLMHDLLTGEIQVSLPDANLAGTNV